MASAKDICSDKSGNEEEERIIDLDEKLRFYRENNDEVKRANMFLSGSDSLAELSYIGARLDPRLDQGAGINMSSIGYIRKFQAKTGDNSPDMVLI